MDHSLGELEKFACEDGLSGFLKLESMLDFRGAISRFNVTRLNF